VKVVDVVERRMHYVSHALAAPTASNVDFFRLG
jgi:hypothetical protein